MRRVSAWVTTHAPTGTRWGQKALSLLLCLALCLTLLPGAAFAANSDTSGHWAEKTITEWQQKGYISGYSDGSFRPDSSITRAEFIKILNRVLGLTAEAGISFTDVREGDWFYAEVAKAVAAGYATGSGSTFRPNAPITRAEAAAMLARAFKLTANEKRAAQFTDADAIPAWAKGSVGAVAEAGYMTGYPDGSFGASGNITRAEAVVTADRAERAAAEDTKKPTSPGSSSGGTVTPPAQQGKTVTGIKTVIDDITVDYGTSADAAIAKLPQKVTLNCKDGSTVEADVTWELERAFTTTPDNTTEYTATGTVTIPTGYTYNGTLTVTAKITVWGHNQTVDSIIAPDGIEVETGKLADANAAIAALPKQVVLMDSAGSSIKDNGANVLADVKWESTGCTITNTGNLKAVTTGFKGTLNNNEVECFNTFSGTVTLPDGYRLSSDASTLTLIITTRITVKRAGEVQLKTIASASIADIADQENISKDRLVQVLKDNGKLPTTLDLYCGNQFVATVDIPDGTAWKAEKSTTSKDGYTKYTLTPRIDWSSITPPIGYQLQSGLGPNCSVYVKKADTSGLKEMIRQLTELKARFTNDELEALENPEKVYQAPDKTAADVAKDVTFVTTDIITELTKDIRDAGGYLTDETKSQDDIQKKINDLQFAYNAVNSVLDQAKTGTGFTKANIRYNAKEAVKTEAAWLTDGQPLKAESSYKLPLTLNDITTDENNGKSTVTLEWSCASKDSDVTIGDYITINNNGSVTITAPTTPQKITFTATVMLGEQAIGNISFDGTLGAPIRVYQSAVNIAVAELISGKNQSFGFDIPIPDNRPMIKAVDTEQIEVQCSALSGSITVQQLTLDTDTRGSFSCMKAQLTATTKQLSAVVDSNQPDEVPLTLSIPSDAIELVEWASEEDWYIPEDGAELTVNVRVWHPLVKITGAKPEGKTEVKVTFDAKHSDSIIGKGVFMALVPSTQDTFTGKEAGSIVSTNGPVLTGDGNYDTKISISGITARTEYTVWVKIDSDSTTWLKSNTTYTHSST